MTNYKKMDDQDFIFINKPLTVEEEKEFSEFIKNLKSKNKVKRKIKSTVRKKRELA